MKAVAAKPGDTIHFPSGPAIIVKRYTLGKTQEVELHVIKADGSKAKVILAKDKDIQVTQNALATKLGNAPGKASATALNKNLAKEPPAPKPAAVQTQAQKISAENAIYNFKQGKYTAAQTNAHLKTLNSTKTVSGSGKSGKVHDLEGAMKSSLPKQGPSPSQGHAGIAQPPPGGNITHSSSHGKITQVSKSEMAERQHELDSPEKTTSRYNNPEYAKAKSELSSARTRQSNGEGSFGSMEVRNAWGSYIGSGYQSMNADLRAGKTNSKATKLKTGYTPPPAQPLPVNQVYRGVRNDPVGGKLKPGDTFTDKGFVSTTHNPRTASSFSGGVSNEPYGYSSAAHGNTVYVIKPGAGTKSKPVIGGTDYESEWILPPGSSFKVGNITAMKRGDGNENRIVELEWIN